MKDVHALYDTKLTTAEEAANSIGNQSNLILGMGVAMPPAFMAALASRVRSDRMLDWIRVYYMHANAAAAESILSSDLMHVLRLHPLFMGPHDRKFAAEGRTKGETWMHFVPAMFHQAGRLLTEQIEPDCFVTTVSPMDRSGHFSLGTNADYGGTLVRRASRVIVEVNHNMPRTFGENLLHVSQVDKVIEHDCPLMEIPQGVPSSEDQKIAALIAEEIPDQATIQMGVGGVPEAVISALSGHRDLGLHSELLSKPMIQLIQEGVLTGAKKTLMPHKHVFTLALGDSEMYDFMNDNPSFVGYPATWVNSPAVIRKNANMISVNSALQVDLTGQINSETLDGHQFSGTGGQLDFVRGAYLAQGGKSFIALHSTAKKGSVSRLVPQLGNAAVTDPRMESHFVVTEFGKANLKGLSLAERASTLIKLAHPKFREQLEHAAKSQILV